MIQHNPKKSNLASLDTNLTSDVAALTGDLLDAITGLPIVSIAKSLYESGMGVRDYFFYKKVIRFATEVNTIPSEELQKQLDNMLADPSEQERFAEHLVLALERHDDTRKASILGKIAVGLLREELSLLEFWRMNHAVDAISLDEEWPILQVIAMYKEIYYKNGNLVHENWDHEDILRDMVNDRLNLNISDGDLRSIVIRINQTGLFGCLGWRRGPAHDCEISPWYFILKRYMSW